MKLDTIKKNQKTVVITGATSGIGKTLVKTYFDLGYKVFMIARNIHKASTLNQLYGGKLEIFIADLSQMNEVKEVAYKLLKHFKKHNLKLNLLINNAGGIKDYLLYTEDGFEYQWALNHLSGFLLMHELLPILKHATVLYTSSRAHYKNTIHFDDLFYEKHYRVTKVYQQSKLASLMSASYLKSILKVLDTRVYAVDPGLVKSDLGSKDTKFIHGAAWKIYQILADSPNKCARTYVYLSEQQPDEGLYFKNQKIKAPAKYLDNIEALNQLIVLSLNQLKIDFITRIKELLHDESSEF